MELTDCEKCVLEHIFLSQPSSKDVIITATAFTRMLGRSWTEEEIRHVLASLISRQLVLEVTPEIAASILKELRGVHGPLVPMRTTSHYSVTATGGSTRFTYCPLDDPWGAGGRGVVSVEHSQFFTPAESRADQLVATGVFSGSKLNVFNVYLAPNNENVDGFIVDLIAAPDGPSHPIKLLSEHITLLQRELEQRFGKQSGRTCNGLTPGEAWALIQLSGYSGSSAFQGAEQNDVQSLFTNGLVRELKKEETIQLNQRLLSRHSIPFGPKARSGMRILSNNGRESLFQILEAIPNLKQHLMASRIVGEYIHQYFPSVDRAIEVRAKLKESGMVVTGVERIGRWCYYWWDEHSDGARFSYWNGDVA